MRNKYRRVAAIAVSTLTAIAATALPSKADAANTVYVYDDSGWCNDEAPDAGTLTTPFCTVPAALASSSVVSGTTLLMRGDFGGGIDVTKSGITLQGWGGAWGVVGGAYGISIVGQHDVRVDQARMEEQTGEALRIDSSTNVAVDGSSATLSQNGVSTPDPALPAVAVTGSTGVTLSGAYIAENPGPGLLVQDSRQVSVGTTIATADEGGVAVADSTAVDVVSDTIDENCGAGVSVRGASSDVSVADDIISNARACGATPATALSVDTSGATPVVDSDILTTAAGTDAVMWQGQSFAGGPALDEAGHGTADLSTDPGFAAPVVASLNRRKSFALAPGSPAIDSADSGARGMPALDQSGVARVDDPAVADSGTGPTGYADRGALEFTRSATPSLSATASPGGSPATYRTATVQVHGSGTDSWWPVTSYDVSYGDGGDSGPLPYSDLATAPSHTYTADKDYTGTVTFTDSHGRTFTSQFGVTVAPHYFAPPFSVERAYPPNPDGTITATFHAAAGPALQSYTIDFGDHSPPVSGTYPLGQMRDVVETHTYAKSGTYTVTATATDTLGWPTAQPLRQTITVSVPTPVHRIGGTDRYDTARLVSQAQWRPGTASAVVLARGDAAPDALTGVPLAAGVHGPLLLTAPTVLDGATRAEIDRATGGPSASKTVYILGGAAAVSPGIEAELRKAGYRVIRYQGTDRYGTALAIAKTFGQTSHVIVATGKTFPDALAAGPLGAVENAPIVLSGELDRLDPATAAFVRAHPDVDPVGGAAGRAVSALNLGPGHVVNPGLAGATRYDTAADVARDVIAQDAGSGHPATDFGVASGQTFADALTGGAYAANSGIPLLLTDPKTLSSATAGVLSDQFRTSVMHSVTVFGGPQAVSYPVETEIIDAVNGEIE